MNFTNVSITPGSRTLEEILSQPRCWISCLAHIARSPEWSAALRLAKPGVEWTFIGCGSSYYLAQVAASTFLHFGLNARALPASEVLLYPNLAMPTHREYIPVMISRSGLTSEVLSAARLLREKRNLKTIALTCGDGHALSPVCDVVLKLRDADETSTVMTRSFTSMLLGLQWLGARIADNETFCEALRQLSEQVSYLFADTPPLLNQFVQQRNAADYVFLAQGPLVGIAHEAMLKMTECSCSYTQVFHALEFRHGPKSIAGPDTLITFLMSESSYEAELEVLREMKDLGAQTFVIANAVDARARKVADSFIELGLAVPEFARPAAYTVWGQLFGVYAGLKKSLDPDSPKNLTRVVVLNGQS